jgi:hypothetical protein
MTKTWKHTAFRALKVLAFFSFLALFITILVEANHQRSKHFAKK